MKNNQNHSTPVIHSTPLTSEEMATNLKGIFVDGQPALAIIGTRPYARSIQNMLLNYCKPTKKGLDKGLYRLDGAEHEAYYIAGKYIKKLFAEAATLHFYTSNWKSRAQVTYTKDDENNITDSTVENETEMLALASEEAESVTSKIFTL
jgi:hypothetical protein